MIDLTELSLPQLTALQQQVAAEIPRRLQSERKKAIDELKQLALARGFDLHDLLGAVENKGKGKRGPAPVKYRSKDGLQTWSGRGRTPAWIKAHLEQGGQLETLAV